MANETYTGVLTLSNTRSIAYLVGRQSQRSVTVTGFLKTSPLDDPEDEEVVSRLRKEADSEDRLKIQVIV